MKYSNLIFIYYSPRISGKNPFFKALAKSMSSDNNFNLIAITNGTDSIEDYKDVLINWSKEYDMIEFFHKNQDEYSLDKLIELQEKYSLDRLNEVFEYAIILFSKHFPGFSYTDAQKEQVLYLFIKFWEKVFQENPHSIIIDEGIAGLHTFLYSFSKKFNCLAFNLIASPVTNRFLITHDWYGTYESKTEEMIEKLSGQSKKISHKAIDFLETFEKKYEKPEWFSVYNVKKNKIKIIDGFKFLKTIYKYSTNESNFLVPKLSYIVKNKFSSYNARIIMKTMKWDAFDKSVNYIFYPLHVEPEATVNVLGTYYSNQLNLIKQIALSLPVGVSLIVKEHPAFLGKRKSSYYKEIQRIKGVHLVNPFFDSMEIIKAAKSIITISGTVGFEAILLRKPVIVFSNVYYSYYKNAYKVTDITKLYDIIVKCLENSSNIDKEDVLEFLSIFFEISFEGNLFFYKKDGVDIGCDIDNISRIKDGILKELNYLELKVK